MGIEFRDSLISVGNRYLPRISFLANYASYSLYGRVAIYGDERPNVASAWTMYRTNKHRERTGYPERLRLSDSPTRSTITRQLLQRDGQDARVPRSTGCARAACSNYGHLDNCVRHYSISRHPALPWSKNEIPDTRGAYS
jgi:hypothetical protein